jgi:hypothetical protein
MCQANRIVTAAIKGEGPIGHAERNRLHQNRLREAKEELDALMKEEGFGSSASDQTSATTSSIEVEAGSGTANMGGVSDEALH